MIELQSNIKAFPNTLNPTCDKNETIILSSQPQIPFVFSLTSTFLRFAVYSALRGLCLTRIDIWKGYHQVSINTIRLAFISGESIASGSSLATTWDVFRCVCIMNGLRAAVKRWLIFSPISALCSLQEEECNKIFPRRKCRWHTTVKHRCQFLQSILEAIPWLQNPNSMLICARLWVWNANLIVGGINLCGAIRMEVAVFFAFKSGRVQMPPPNSTNFLIETATELEVFAAGVAETD